MKHAALIARKRLPQSKGGTPKLVVNNYWRAAIEAKAQHLHLGQEDLPEADIPRSARPV